ncbi:MAG: hypothetical protein D6753_14860 [Planctomycetota bacterium]|nr:MAG: hypothetical protein D6753_14860 [Planctomycetota bacterium]
MLAFAERSPGGCLASIYCIGRPRLSRRVRDEREMGSWRLALSQQFRSRSNAVGPRLGGHPPLPPAATVATTRAHSLLDYCVRPRPFEENDGAMAEQSKYIKTPEAAEIQGIAT